MHYTKNKHKIVKSRSTIEPKGYLSQDASSSFNSNHKQSITVQLDEIHNYIVCTKIIRLEQE